ncbi:MAG: DUF1207 domain-containing protein [Methylococcales bacterium]
MRPIVAADIKHFDENNWSSDISARAGVEFDNLHVLGRKLQILVEYFNGICVCKPKSRLSTIPQGHD